MLVQSFRVIHHSPGHNSAEPGPIPTNLVSLESWALGLQFDGLRFLYFILFIWPKTQKPQKTEIFEALGP